MRLPQRLQRIAFPSRWTSLRARMTISYVAVTIGIVFSFLLLQALAVGAVSAFAPPSTALSSDMVSAMQRQARTYATIAALRAQGGALDPETNFIPDQAHSIAVAPQDNQRPAVFAPYVITGAPAPTSVVIALLVAPGGRLVASSYPARYPAGMAVSTLTPDQTRAIDRALAGQASTGNEPLPSITLGYAAEPVLSADHQPIGAIFLQVPGPTRDGVFSRLWSAVSSATLLLLVVTPVGVIFGWIAARGLARRVRQLALATQRFAGGDYAHRIAPTGADEIGQLERQFNQMAAQLIEQVSHRQRLAEQNARLEERARISRELHDAISQDLFSLRMLSDGMQQAARAGSSAADLRPQITVLEQTTSNMTREMRALLLELRPTQLEHLGLPEALRQLADAYTTRLGITVSADVADVPLDVKTEHALLRIAQESLANAARHSSATRVALGLTSDGSAARLTISDNGQGFITQDAAEGHGLGLALMRERVAELAGAVHVSSALGAGACITVTVPQQEVVRD
ncbi:MAG TPA: HAMP domain-containing protein [Ktedonobacterales bacterium]|nr:HAMP domain-containing protein [Ktedonobacterales bacterium]